MQKGAIIGIVAAVAAVAVAVPLAGPLFTEGGTVNEPLPDGAIDLNDGMMDDRDGSNVGDGQMGDGMMDDGMMGDGQMDDRMMDDGQMGDGMMDDNMMDGGSMDDTMMDDNMMDEGSMDDTMMDDNMMDEGSMDDTMTDDTMTDDTMMEDNAGGAAIPEEMMDDSERAIEDLSRMVEENGDAMGEEMKGQIEDMIEEIKKSGVRATDEPMEEMMPEAMPEMAEVARYFGTFSGADMYAHNVEGTVQTIPTEDGTTYVRLNEDFKTGNGPHLVVLLVPDYTKGGDWRDNVKLGDLRGTSGAQNYEVPAGTDLEKYNTVLIWCEPFSALFGWAPLEPPGQSG
ncbi:hypothetical protein IBTHAUMO2_1070030 [Nitrosopumilaceae archaeon]|nr:DM13 domain-containing protein [Nitrosopumilus sp.]MDA7945276.1 DM13 domain-containing protein [Nitrosopumilus sp.]MDA7955214.1 DM13 domain-containing protein [Nitrosopumilus sp.]CAI9830755.1 hypothetical protein IBTHAUMO2_1070030 [Nitrosopumilaceae archaeon]